MSIERFGQIPLKQAIQNIHYELIERCRAGERDAFYKIYRLYAKAMYNVSLRITGREDEAEDALQESFSSAFKNIHSYRADASFGSWLKKIVINRSINALQKRRMEALPENEDWDIAEEEPIVEYGEFFNH